MNEHFTGTVVDGYARPTLTTLGAMAAVAVLCTNEGVSDDMHHGNEESKDVVGDLL